MYSLAAQCIFIKIQILGEPGNMTDIRNALFPYLFREEYYEGLVPNNQHFTSNGAVPGPKSFKCRCHYPINCVPEDGYEVILQYDNKKGKTPITLTYTKTIGISLSAEIQASFSVSNTKTSSISHRFWWIFFQHFTVTQTSSQTTTYDWSVKVAADFSATTSLEAQITIQPGKTIQILQAVGKCGDSEVRTSLFKVKTLEGYKKILWLNQILLALVFHAIM